MINAFKLEPNFSGKWRIFVGSHFINPDDTQILPAIASKINKPGRSGECLPLSPNADANSSSLESALFFVDYFLR